MQHDLWCAEPACLVQRHDAVTLPAVACPAASLTGIHACPVAIWTASMSSGQWRGMTPEPCSPARVANRFIPQARRPLQPERHIRCPKPCQDCGRRPATCPHVPRGAATHKRRPLTRLSLYAPGGLGRPTPTTRRRCRSLDSDERRSMGFMGLQQSAPSPLGTECAPS